MIAEFFQRHPKLTVVLAFALAICGALSLAKLSVSDYPELTPPRIYVGCSYSGASPQVVADTVATPIEDKVNTCDNLRAMSSSCYDSGAYALGITFEPGTDPDMALVNVQNAIKLAEPKLPAEVKQAGLTVCKQPHDYVLRVGLTTDGTKMDGLALGNYTVYEIKTALERVPGVGRVSVSDREYSMWVWTDPGKMDALGISVADVRKAIDEQNIQPAAGSVGHQMSSPYLSYKINVRGRLVDEREFANIVVRSDPETGRRVLLGDIARCELGASSYANEPMLDGETVYLLCVYADPRANSMQVIEDCKAELARWQKRLPEGVKMLTFFDKSIFTSSILGRIGKSGILAIVLAAFLASLLCRSLRLAFVSTVAVPFVLLGGILFLALAGWTLDVFSALAILLATGAVLFNGVAAAERRSAGVICASALVSLAVYLPLVFYGGTIGGMYVRFGMTLAATVMVSALLAVSFGSVTAHRLLGAAPRRSPPGRSLFVAAVRGLARHPFAALLLLALIGLSVLIPARRVTKGCMPDEDRGYLEMEIELSEGSSMHRTVEVGHRLTELLKDVPGLKHTLVSACSSVLSKTGENHAEVYFILEDPEDRPGITLDMVKDEIERRVRQIAIADFTVLKLPPINGLGGTGGVGIFACAIGDVSPAELEADAHGYTEKLRASPLVHSAIDTFSASTPQLYFSVDRDKAYKLGVSASTIFSTLQNKLASFYVNDFNLAGGSHQVMVQNDFDTRDTLEDAKDIRFPGNGGKMVPLSSVGKFEYRLGPRIIHRYNKRMCSTIYAEPVPGVTSLDVVNMVERDPPSPARYLLDWTDMTKEEISTRGRLGQLLLMALVFAYLILVAKFESWRVPLAALLPSVVAIAGGYWGLYLAGQPTSVYTQLAILMLIEFPTRYSIFLIDRVLIRQAEGLDLDAAIAEGASEAYAPIVVSALGFAVALASFLFASGIGANTLLAVALPIFGGVVASFFLGVVFAPALVRLFLGKKGKRVNGQA